jgi:superfamily II DNA or RNA helicase
MSVKIDGSKAEIFHLSKTPLNNGCLVPGQGCIYITSNNKLGEFTAESYSGVTPSKAFELRYKGSKSSLSEDLVANAIIVFDVSDKKKNYDNDLRKEINKRHKKGLISFSANYTKYQEENTNGEALLKFNKDRDLPDLINIFKHMLGLTKDYCTKINPQWRWMQEKDISDILNVYLNNKHRCLFSAYTGRGKTMIAIEVAARHIKEGGFVLVTTPISDTKKSFEENIENYHFGYNRNRKITYIDSKEFKKYNVKELIKRKLAGELIFIVLTVQDVRYSENSEIQNEIITLRSKYKFLVNNIDLWIIDERHSQYEAPFTKKVLSEIKPKKILDLTATPYKVYHYYNNDEIVSRSLLWGLKYREHTKLPKIRIEVFNTPFSSISDRIASIYSSEEGFDPRKLFARENLNFVLQYEIIELPNRLYTSSLSKKKNPLSIINDPQLSTVSKKCGMWVLPQGQNGDSAGEYIPALAKLLNENVKGVHFIDSYAIEKNAKKRNITINEYVETLLKEYKQVIILTCGKFIVGTDIPPLGHIVLMDKISDISGFEQLLGRLIRLYPGKDEVKLYSLVPGNDLMIVMGLMSKKTSELDKSCSTVGMLDCIPLTEYDINGNNKTYTTEEILSSVQDYYKSSIKNKLSSNNLYECISKFDLKNTWKNIDINNFKFKTKFKNISLTNKNGSKVKNIYLANLLKNKNNKQETNRIEQIEELIQAIMKEAQWVSFTTNNFDVIKVLSNNAIKEMFSEEVMDVVITEIKKNKKFESILTEYLNVRKEAYSYLLQPEDGKLEPSLSSLKILYEEIFENTTNKQKLGLVYMSFDLAEDIVKAIPKNKYTKGKINIGVVNALNGALPIVLKREFPNAEIVCLEYFNFFIDHLERLGFNVIKWDNLKDMKFDIIIGNPPYQGNQSGGNKTHSLWKKFIHKLLPYLKQDGTLCLVTPTTWIKCEKTKKLFLTKNLKSVNILSKDIFNVGVDICWWLLENNNNYKNTEFIINNTKRHVNINKNIPSIYNNIIKDEYFSIQNKTLENKKYFKISQSKIYYASKIKNDKFKYPIFNTNAQQLSWAEKEPKDLTLTKVLFSNCGEFNPIYDEGTRGTCWHSHAIEVKNEKEGNNLINYLNSKLIKFLNVNNRSGGFATDFFCYHIPYVDISKSWTDQELYEYFNLTQEEIDLIESTIKD